MGYLDRDGYAVVKGRRDDMFVSGGENIYPGEIESIVADHKSVKDCAVIAVENNIWGEKALLFVEPCEPDFKISQLQRYLDRRLPKFKTPKHIEVIQSLPRTTLGKIDRTALRKIHREQHSDLL